MAIWGELFWVPFSGNFHDRMSAKKSLKGPENKMTNSFLSRGYIFSRLLYALLLLG